MSDLMPLERADMQLHAVIHLPHAHYPHRLRVHCLALGSKHNASTAGVCVLYYPRPEDGLLLMQPTCAAAMHQ